MAIDPRTRHNPELAPHRDRRKDERLNLIFRMLLMGA